MKHFGVYSTDNDIDTAVNNKQLVNPYVAIYNNNTSIDYNTRKKIYTFGTYEIAPGPVIYRNSKFEIDTNAYSGPVDNGWQADGWTITCGLNEGSYWFTYSNLSSFVSPLENEGFVLPSPSRLSKILGTSRPGSTVGEKTGVCYIRIDFSGSLNSSRPYYGFLLFPDNETIDDRYEIVKTINTMNVGYNKNYIYQPQDVSIKQAMQYYIDQGCVFLPIYNFYYNSGNNKTLYIMTTQSTSMGYIGTASGATTVEVNTSTAASFANYSGMIILIRPTVILE